MNNQSSIYVVDDDPGIQSYLTALAKSKGLESEVFSSANEFLDRAKQGSPLAGCAVIDVKLPGMTGLQLLEKMGEQGIRLPVIMVTGFADVPLAVQAMKAGAVTFLEKPFEEADLWEHVQAALEDDKRARQDQQRKSVIESRFTELTAEESSVMMKMLRGMPNKRIAVDLDIGLRTVELRRANVLRKMQVESLAELVRLAMQVGKMPAMDENL